MLQIPEAIRRKLDLDLARDLPSGFIFLVCQLILNVTIWPGPPKRVENEVALKPASEDNVEVTKTGRCCSQTLNESGPHLGPKDLDTGEDVDHGAGSRLHLIRFIGRIASRCLALNRGQEEMVIGVGEVELEGPDAVSKGVLVVYKEAIRILRRGKDEGGVVEQRCNRFPVPGRGQLCGPPCRPGSQTEHSHLLAGQKDGEKGTALGRNVSAGGGYPALHDGRLALPVVAPVLAQVPGEQVPRGNRVGAVSGVER